MTARGRMFAASSGGGGATASYDVIVIGGGANGLIAATALAQAGSKVLVLERGETLGGQSRTIEFAPGFRAAPLGLDPGWVPPAVERLLGAPLMPAVDEHPLAVPVDSGKFLQLTSDVTKTAEMIRPFSSNDADRWPAFVTKLRTLAGFLEVLYQTPAPDIDARSLDELLPMLHLGLEFRGLGRADMIGFLRTLPMSVWELLDDAFEFGPLKAAIAAGGVQDFQQGPRSGGTGFTLLHQMVGAPRGMVRGRMPWAAGPMAFTVAAEAAARRAGATIRTGAPVARVRVHDDAVVGVTLANGDEIGARAVLSTADPHRTLLDWIDPVWLEPEFLHAVGNIRYRGCTAYVLYGLDARPEIAGLPPSAPGGLVTLTSSLVALERAADAAKYGTMSETPHVEFTVPTIAAPVEEVGKPVLIARVQYAPYALADGATWDAARKDTLANATTVAIATAWPAINSRTVQRVVWSPRDLEERFGLHHGAATHGELGLDQILFMRPVAGWGRYAMPISGLYLGGAGAHPGPGVLGGAGLLAARRLIGDRKKGRRSA